MADDLENIIRNKVKQYIGPIADQAELVSSKVEPSSYFIRQRIRERSLPHAEASIIEFAPKERQLIFTVNIRLGKDQIEAIRRIIVIADLEGNILDIIESR
jgi:Trk K+ transport system NAD-binding subunit